jgi:hypothetical protein
LSSATNHIPGLELPHFILWNLTQYPVLVASHMLCIDRPPYRNCLVQESDEYLHALCHCLRCLTLQFTFGGPSDRRE